MANPNANKGAILMAIQPKVSTIPNAAWFVQYASGYVQWAQNAQSKMIADLGIKWDVIEMGADQYNRLLAMATNGAMGSWG
jgi:hypothetical protein